MNLLAKNLRQGWDRIARVKAAITGHRFPVKLDEDVRPVYVIGSGRSGTTLLRRILMAGGELHIPPEFEAINRIVRRYKKRSYRGWKPLCRIVTGCITERSRFDNFELTERQILDRLESIPPQRRSLASMVDEFYRLHSEINGTGCTRWGDKTPKNTEYIDILHDLFPNALFVHSLRDGVDVVLSWIRTGIYTSLEHSIETWIQRVRLAREFAARHPDKCVELRYEEFVVKPEKHLKPLFEFLGLTWNPAIIDRTDHASKMGDVPRRKIHDAVMKPVGPDAVGKGRRELNEAMRSKLQPLNDTLTEFGYDPV